MEIKIEDFLLPQIQMISTVLVFDGGKGVLVTKLKNIFEDDYFTIIKECKKLFLLLGMAIRESDERLYLMPLKETYINLQQENLSDSLPRLSKKHRMVLLRFLTLYYSQGKSDPISLHKLKFELNENFNISVFNSDIQYLAKLGYLKFIRKNFVDIGWKLKNSPELASFQKKLRSIFIDIFDLKQEINTSSTITREEGENAKDS